MKLEQSFEVDAPLERVWQTLIDVEHVAPCLPGAAVTGRNEDGSYNGTFTVKIGPTTASYAGRLEMEDVDEASHSATMQAQGTDKRGQGGAKATIHSRLAPVDGRGTRVDVVTDYHITGRLARFGRGGMIEDISERLLREFAKNLQSSLVSPTETAMMPTIQRSDAAPATETGPGESAGGPGADEGRVAPGPSMWPAAGAAAAASGATEAPAEPVPPTQAPPEPPTGVASPPPASPQPPFAEAAAPIAESAVPPPPTAEPPPFSHPPQASEPMQGLSLVGSVMWSRVKRNPAPAAAAGGAVVLLLLARRRRRRR